MAKVIVPAPNQPGDATVITMSPAETSLAINKEVLEETVSVITPPLFTLLLFFNFVILEF